VDHGTQRKVRHYGYRWMLVALLNAGTACAMEFEETYDLAVCGPRRDGTPWYAAIQNFERARTAAWLSELWTGASATSGDTYRHLISEGVRNSHLNPKTGRPIAGAPRSVIVHPATCAEAGLLAKLALLKGPGAEEFLKSEKGRAWRVR
jgi:thiamine biosynthesis lipoprotein